MFKRALQPEIEKAAKKLPVVTINGPRQSGKTTLVRALFPHKPYVNLEALDIREFATQDPRRFLEQYPEGAVLDEIQNVPKLLSYIQTIVDEKERAGLYILTGSHQLELHQAISQSLAGRTAILTLLPMSLKEIEDAEIELTLDEALLTGGYPRIYNSELNPTKTYREYVQTYIERDVRQLIHIKDLVQFQRFIRLCAGRVGQLLNVESLGNDVGVSSHTIKNWLSILEASYVIVRLAPYFENFGKRIVKTPKLYFTDVGLLSFLLGIETVEQLKRDPLRGNIVENLVLLELIKARLNLGLDPNLYFFRDSHGHEVDIIYKNGHQLLPIEVKSAMTYTSDFSKRIHYFQQLVGERAPKGYIIYAGHLETTLQSIELINYKKSSQII